MRLFVQPEKKFNPMNAASFNKLLGAWFDVFPFALSDIAGSLKAHDDSDSFIGALRGFGSRSRVPVPPFIVSSTKVMEALDAIENDKKTAMKEHNSLAKKYRGSLCLQSTQENRKLGGQSLQEPGFSNVLQAYFREILVEDVYKGESSGLISLHLGLGITSNHRRMRHSNIHLLELSTIRSNEESPRDLSYLRFEDVPLAQTLKNACRSIFCCTQSLKGIMTHCENLGHNEIPPFNGLTVDLLQFQRQAVQWALEREQMEGGIQCFLWPELPRIGSHRNQQPVYFNPITETFRTTKPNLVRGGMIASEM